MTRISEHYDLTDCSRLELVQLQSSLQAQVNHSRRKSLLALLGFVSAQEGLATVNAILKAKYPDVSEVEPLSNADKP